MRIFMMILMLSIFCAQAYAGWSITPYASGGDGTFYWDDQTVKYDGNRLKIWLADDFGEAQISKFKPGKKFLTIEEQLELDCATSKSRIIDYMELSEHFSPGTMITHDEQKAAWNNVEPDDLSSHVMKAFCKKPQLTPR